MSAAPETVAELRRLCLAGLGHVERALRIQPERALDLVGQLKDALQGSAPARARAANAHKGIDWDAEIPRMIEHGETRLEAARRLGCGKSSVHLALKRRGVKLPCAPAGRPRKGSEPAPPPRPAADPTAPRLTINAPRGIDWDRELKAALAAGESPAVLSRRLGCALATTVEAARRRGVKLVRGQQYRGGRPRKVPESSAPKPAAPVIKPPPAVPVAAPARVYVAPEARQPLPPLQAAPVAAAPIDEWKRRRIEADVIAGRGFEQIAQIRCVSIEVVAKVAQDYLYPAGGGVGAMHAPDRPSEIPERSTRPGPAPESRAMRGCLAVSVKPPDRGRAGGARAAGGSPALCLPDPFGRRIRLRRPPFPRSIVEPVQAGCMLGREPGLAGPSTPAIVTLWVLRLPRPASVGRGIFEGG